MYRWYWLLITKTVEVRDIKLDIINLLCIISYSFSVLFVYSFFLTAKKLLPFYLINQPFIYFDSFFISRFYFYMSVGSLFINSLKTYWTSFFSVYHSSYSYSRWNIGILIFLNQISQKKVVPINFLKRISYHFFNFFLKPV